VSAQAPDGATRVGPWETYEGTGGAQSRTVVWTERADGVIVVDGRQWPDGGIDAAVSMYITDGTPLNAAQARAIAVALLDAADELDGLTAT